MSEQMIEDLKQTGDFLSLSRANEWHLDSFEFVIDHGVNQGVKVSVWDTGVICFEPASHVITDKDIVLSSAIHGNETAPIEICDQLIKDLLRAELTLQQRLLLIFGNPASINIGDRFVEENLNRLFNGTHSTGVGLVNRERQRAKALEGYVTRFFDGAGDNRFRCHYDLHTAIQGSKNEKFAIYPFLNGGKWQKSQFEFLHACGINTFLLMQKPATTFSYFSACRFGAHAFTVELGKVRPFGENDMSRFAATAATLAALISNQAINSKPYDPANFNCFSVYKTIDKQSDQFKLNFANDCENFTDFPLGYVLAEDGASQYTVDTVGEAIIFPNAGVAIGQRALLTVIPVDISDKIV